jgi:hypothetical protein
MFDEVKEKIDCKRVNCYRKNMQEYDVEYVLQKNIKKYPNVKPRIISDNGNQFFPMI